MKTIVPARAIVLALAAAGLARAGDLSVETVPYGDWKNNLRIANGDAQLLITLDVGPRILEYRLLNQPGGESPNVLKVVDEQVGTTGEKGWIPRGGHRLWTAPEDLTRTYAPDNRTVSYELQTDGSVRLIPPPDAPYGIQKMIDVKLAPSGSDVTVTHHITNVGSAPTELAVWALTVLKPGGVEVLPMPPGRPHPGPPESAASPADYAADRLLVLWPYFDFTDPRWTFGSKFITLRQDPERGPTKIGLASRQGWAAYWVEGVTFLKQFDYLETSGGKPTTYPDGGVNFETFSNQDMLEMETLGPLVTLAPGETATHVERWSLIPGIGAPVNEGLIERELIPRIK